MRSAVLGAATHVGRVRERNEDTCLVGDLDRGASARGDAEVICDGARGPLAVLCDGMGGAAGGEVASELAAAAVWSEMRDAQATDDPEIYARILRRAVRIANLRVLERSELDPALRGMGTTLSAVGVAGRYLVVAQIGDSRVYVHRGGALTQVTRDQTLMAALIGAGRENEAAIEASLGGATILQAVGVAGDVDPSLSIVELRRGDRVLVCSDGLYNQVGSPVIQAIVVDHREPRRAARALCAAACAAGGHDNITAVVMEIADDELELPDGDEVPRFAEFDPHDEGPRALTETSNVVRRLSARAGIGTDPGPPMIPTTGQHRIVLDPQRSVASGPPPAAATSARSSAPPRRPASVSVRQWIALGVSLLFASALGWWIAGGP